jgi:acetyltransferase-like isoleucine patch superfamily enzyme
MGGSISIGANCRIHEFALVYSYGGSIRIGDRVTVNPFCVLYGHGGLEIGNDVRIAAHVVIIPANHIFAESGRPITEQGVRAQGVVIEDDIWIGTGARILDGIRLSRGCVIGAGSVVTRSTEPFGVYAGVPARLIKTRRE